jgi:succinate dehydrogenase / fumarate reductase cytochrome b subunit
MRFLQSTLGLKVIMALTGIVLVGFVTIHMLGNLQIFIPFEGISGSSAIDKYGHLLKSNAVVLWGARLVLLGSVFGHIFAAVKLTKRSMSARPRQYELRRWFSDSYAVRTMRWGGVIVLLFIVYHLLHFTVGVDATLFTEVKHCSTETCFVRENVIRGFQNPLISSFYILAQGALGLHLTHGVWSLFRTLGVSSEQWNTRSRTLALIVGGTVTLGNIAIPLSILMGLIK